jgi:GcrA cell cycle regulator
MTWTDARIETLTSLWGDGLSASLIAARLGATTRNAVIGKVRRLALASRKTVVSRRPPRASLLPASKSQPRTGKRSPGRPGAFKEAGNQTTPADGAAGTRSRA